MWQRRLARVVAGHVYFPRKQTFQVTLVVANVTQDGDQGGRGPGWLLANVQSMKTRLTRLPRTSSQLQSSTHHHRPSPTSPPPKEKQNPVFLWLIFKRTYICYNSKRASLMHVAPRIAVHCWQYAPDVVSDMPRIYQRLPLDGAVIGTFDFCLVCSDWTIVVFWGYSKTAARWRCHWNFWILLQCSVCTYVLIEPELWSEAILW